ncbi:MAG: hypothetical protein E6Q39_00820 [Crocinitomicaceae bacterium]|nr:MAG: hypothetical protein E6Q39_00820 [Crocinitomicaceae bacterium]
MLSKKYSIVAGLLSVFATTALQAQENSGMYKGSGFDVADSSLIPANRLPQQRDFLNNQYDFPAKPRNQWEIGINGGFLNVSGDVRSKSIFNGAIKPLNTLGWGLTVRKAWGYVISTRLQFMHGSASGYNYQSSNGFWAHPSPYQAAGYTNVHYSYKNSMSELSLQVVAALNNIKYHGARNKVSYYVFAGLGGLNYKTMMDMKDASNANYNFASATAGLTGTAWENRKTINDRLKSMFDGDYETEAERNGNYNRGSIGNNGTLRAIGNVGAGAQFKLSKVISLSIEDKFTWTGDDLLDGQRWQEQPYTTGAPVSSSMSRDMDNINYLSIGLNFNLGGNAVSPLWWMNPNDYTYNALKAKSAPSNKCDKDADGDGISDCFDRCPNTPGGVSVDSHGCPFDTDGDGVADYKDKQLITPTECQPVDADGVGRCPEPECCKNRVSAPASCNSIGSGSIDFAANSAKLSSGAMSQLNSLASAMRSNPNCKSVITGNGSGSKIEQQRSWDRVNSVINYMVDKQGIDRERFIFQYGNSGKANSVEYRSAGAGEEGPSNTPPPFPNLRK